VLSLQDFTAAVESERIDRARAIVGLPEKICGIRVEQLTPFLVELLIVHKSPFISGGSITSGAILQFLWILNPGFDHRFNIGADEFVTRHALTLDFEQAAQEISAYLERTFLDAPQGKEELPMYSAAAGIVLQMTGKPFHWSQEKALHTPLRVSYQLLKANAKSLGANVVNTRSGLIMGELIAMQQAWNELHDPVTIAAKAKKASEAKRG
jgi:hypothetical protein